MLLNEMPAYGIIIYVGVSLTAINIGFQVFDRNNSLKYIYDVTIFMGILFIFALLFSFGYIFTEDLFFKELAVLIAFIGSSFLLLTAIALRSAGKVEPLKEEYLPKY